MWELLNENLNLIIIGTSAVLGSLKGNFNDVSKKSMLTRLVNLILGIFCGISVGMHYEDTLAIWLAALSSLVVSMISVSILDTIYILAPTAFKSFIETKLGKKLSKQDET